MIIRMTTNYSDGWQDYYEEGQVADFVRLGLALSVARRLILDGQAESCSVVGQAGVLAVVGRQTGGEGTYECRRIKEQAAGGRRGRGWAR